MKGTAVNRVTLLMCCVALAALMPAMRASAQERVETPQQNIRSEQALSPFFRPRPDQITTVRPVVGLPDLSVLPSEGSILVRTADGVFGTIHGSGLIPGTVVTAWFVVFNNPGNCAALICSAADLSNPDVQGSLLHLSGKIVGPDGVETFGAFRAVGDTTRLQLGPGLLAPFTAQIHMALRTHGPAIVNDPDTLKQQLTTFNGGCPPNNCATVQSSIHEQQ